MHRYTLRLWGWLPLPHFIRHAITWHLSAKYLVGVAGIILNEKDQVLLCYHTYRPTHPWGLPGGGLEQGEPAQQAIEREIWEETGFKAKAEQLLLIRNDVHIMHIGMYFLCRYVDGTFKENAEISHINYFDLDHLPTNIRPSEKEILKYLRPLLADPTPVGSMPYFNIP